MPVGIRSIRWTNTSFLINERPVYFRGFGRHEDSALRGRGLDLVTVARDYELLKWVGANSYRTSHYPYSEEVLDAADRYILKVFMIFYAFFSMRFHFFFFFQQTWISYNQRVSIGGY